MSEIRQGTRVRLPALEGVVSAGSPGTRTVRLDWAALDVDPRAVSGFMTSLVTVPTRLLTVVDTPEDDPVGTIRRWTNGGYGGSLLVKTVPIFWTTGTQAPRTWQSLCVLTENHTISRFLTWSDLGVRNNTEVVWRPTDDEERS